MGDKINMIHGTPVTVNDIRILATGKYHSLSMFNQIINTPTIIVTIENDSPIERLIEMSPIFEDISKKI